jgi:DNA polymerase III delta prime subunit
MTTLLNATTTIALKTGNIPLIEKYRPTNFEDIILDPLNRQLFENIIANSYFPNLLFYGPPGTGKTTTIINLINEYQIKHTGKSKGNIIHLNASDERGIDIIRNQINQFVKSKNLFDIGLKFVILDEVDYMTKNAQQALKYLLQLSTYNVRFCLICNYISKIDYSLQNEFISIRFNKLPKTEIYSFIKNILEKEKIALSDNAIDTIQTIYQSDIRSMINFIQLNQNCSQNTPSTDIEYNIIKNTIWIEMYELLRDCKTTILDINIFIHDISIRYNMDKKNIMQCFFNYIIRNYPEMIKPGFLNTVESIIHNYDKSEYYSIQYFCVYWIKNRL